VCFTFPANAIHRDTMWFVFSACVAIMQNLHDSMKVMRSPTLVERETWLSSFASLYGSAWVPLCVRLEDMIAAFLRFLWN